MTVSINEKAFQIILYGGNGRSSAMEAINVLKKETLKKQKCLFQRLKKK